MLSKKNLGKKEFVVGGREENQGENEAVEGEGHLVHQPN